MPLVVKALADGYPDLSPTRGRFGGSSFGRVLPGSYDLSGSYDRLPPARLAVKMITSYLPSRRVTPLRRYLGSRNNGRFFNVVITAERDDYIRCDTY